jgi:branched-chain amino acid transport system permease protein
LRSLPLTFAGAIALGLIQSYAVGYLPVSDLWTYFDSVIPMLFLIVVMLVMPQGRASLAGRTRAAALPRIGGRQMLAATAGFLGVSVILALTLSTDDLSYASRGVALGIIGLSIMLLTGYGAQVSLCQFTFAGLGAFAMSRVGGTHGSLLGLLAAIGLAGAVGGLVALPAMRLRGLYLALTTLAFAYGMDLAFFSNIKVFGVSLSLQVGRPHLPGISLADDTAYFVFLCIVFAIVAVGLVLVRLSSFGRRLFAMRDSPSAALTLGINIALTKLVTFVVSAGLAGLGGALLGGQQGAVSPNDFTFLISLTFLLLVVVSGIRTSVGALFAGVTYALGPLLQQHLTQPRNILQLLVGLAAIGIAHNAEGTFGGETPLRRWLQGRPSWALNRSALPGRSAHAAD